MSLLRHHFVAPFAAMRSPFCTRKQVCTHTDVCVCGANPALCGIDPSFSFYWTSCQCFLVDFRHIPVSWLCKMAVEGENFSQDVIDSSGWRVRTRIEVIAECLLFCSTNKSCQFETINWIEEVVPTAPSVFFFIFIFVTSRKGLGWRSLLAPCFFPFRLDIIINCGLILIYSPEHNRVGLLSLHYCNRYSYFVSYLRYFLFFLRLACVDLLSIAKLNKIHRRRLLLLLLPFGWLNRFFQCVCVCIDSATTPTTENCKSHPLGYFQLSMKGGGGQLRIVLRTADRGGGKETGRGRDRMQNRETKRESS